MVALYYYWDGRAAPSFEDADWVVQVYHSYYIDYTAKARFWHGIYLELRQMWRKYGFELVKDGIHLKRMGINWGEDVKFWVYLNAIRAWPTVVDLNTIVELELAYESDVAWELIKKGPFRPMSAYGKREGLELEVLIEEYRPPKERIEEMNKALKELCIDFQKRLGWSKLDCEKYDNYEPPPPRREVLVLGPSSFDPFFVRVPVGERYGCFIYDAWGRRAELKPVVRTEAPWRWPVDPVLEIYEGDVPGAGWVICWYTSCQRNRDIEWLKDCRLELAIDAYVNLFGKYNVLIGGSVQPYSTSKYAESRDKMNIWIPNFNKVVADMLVQEEETA